MELDIKKLRKVGYFKPPKKIEKYEQKTGSKFKCDYHIHSYFSHDGKSEPEAIIKKASLNNIKYIAVTDHNTLSFPIESINEYGGFADSVFVDVSHNVKLIPAIEVTSRVELSSGKQKKVHIGVYAPDLSNKTFMRYIKIKDENQKNIDTYYFTAIEKCLNCQFNLDTVKLYLSNLKNKPDFKYVEKEDILKYCKNIAGEVAVKNKTNKISEIDLSTSQKRKEFVEKVDYILKNVKHPVKFNIDAVELIQKANFAGGITVLMHPNATFDSQEELDEVRNILYSNGLYGEEKIYSNIKTMNKLTQPVGYGVSGGSDSHNVYTKKLANVDGIELYANNFSITKKLEMLEEKRAQNPNRANKKIADVSYIKYEPRFIDDKTPTEVMKDFELQKKTQEIEKE